MTPPASHPLTCPGFAATLAMFGFSVDDPAELSRLADELSTLGGSHPVFEAMAIHLAQCGGCLVDGSERGMRVKNPRFGRVA